jgi:hypothetical protein
MRRTPVRAHQESLDPEKVAYWYFRLNGFLQIENFVVQPGRRGGQRTDADLLAVRFPHRAEFLLDHPDHPMLDDVPGLSLSDRMIDVVIAEVKTSRCTLNGPWVTEDRQNVHRILAAVGCVPHDRIEPAARDIYRRGVHLTAQALRIRLVALGRHRSEELANSHPDVIQLTWADLLTFIWNRFRTYRQQKTQVDQWDPQGLRIKQLADQTPDACAFVTDALHAMDARPTREKPD